MAMAESHSFVEKFIPSFILTNRINHNAGSTLLVNRHHSQKQIQLWLLLKYKKTEKNIHSVNLNPLVPQMLDFFFFGWICDEKSISFSKCHALQIQLSSGDFLWKEWENRGKLSK